MHPLRGACPPNPKGIDAASSTIPTTIVEILVEAQGAESVRRGLRIHAIVLKQVPSEGTLSSAIRLSPEGVCSENQVAGETLQLERLDIPLNIA